MEVWVVMGNDFPEGVYDSEAKAAAAIKVYKLNNDQRIYWRAHKFTMNKVK